MGIQALDHLAIDFWVHPSKLGLMQPSLCMFHQSPGYATPLLNAVAEMKELACPSKRTLIFAGCSRKVSLRTMTLLLVPESDDLRVMNIRFERANATIEITEVGRVLLFNAFTSWIAGAEDFGVSPRHSSLKPKNLGKFDRESGELWFWGPKYMAP